MAEYYNPAGGQSYSEIQAKKNPFLITQSLSASRIPTRMNSPMKDFGIFSIPAAIAAVAKAAAATKVGAAVAGAAKAVGGAVKGVGAAIKATKVGGAVVKGATKLATKVKGGLSLIHI